MCVCETLRPLSPSSVARRLHCSSVSFAMGSEGTRHRGVRLPLVHSSPTVACLSLLLLFIAVSRSLVQCQRQTPTEVSPPVNSSSLLLCSQCSNGEPLGSLVVKSPRSDCASGHYHAVPSATDHCHCDLVCARESRQACRLSLPSLDLRITNQTLCDESLSLRCNEATNLCEGTTILDKQSKPFFPSFLILH